MIKSSAGQLGEGFGPPFFLFAPSAAILDVAAKFRDGLIWIKRLGPARGIFSLSI
jgi:hypothetical protein